MNKCEICGKDSGKGRTCGNTCRSKLNRATVSDATVEDATPTATVEAESLDYCIIDGISRPVNYGQEDCTCQHCKGIKMNGLKLTLNHGQYKSAGELAECERNRVALPGDTDYQHAQTGA